MEGDVVRLRRKAEKTKDGSPCEDKKVLYPFFPDS